MSDSTSGGRRQVLVHYHLFKNAGSSIERMLSDSFGDAWASFDKPDPGARIGGREMAQFIESRPELSAVSSHQVVPPVPTGDFDAVPLVFLRHPLARVRSAWLFEWQKQLGLDAPRGTLVEYVEEKLARSWGGVIANFQTHRLATNDPETPRQASKEHVEATLERACAFVDTLPFVGIVEDMSDSLALVASTLAQRFPDLRVVERRENALQADRPIGDRVNALRETLGDALFGELVQRNRHDLELYRYAAGRTRAEYRALERADAERAESERSGGPLRSVLRALGGTHRAA